jgi:FADH2 O2-dependent halogenase
MPSKTGAADKPIPDESRAADGTAVKSAATAKAETSAASKPVTGKTQQCDVVIIGAGLAGSITAAILARQGAKVVLVDATSHPRFAIGESMTPQLIEWLHILALRYDVPEIESLLSVGKITNNISPLHGTKQSFGFVTHHEGREPDPDETNMFVIPKILTEAGHLFRQDTDSYFFHVAAKYGCVTRQNWRAADLDFDDDGVTVTGQNGEVFRAQYLIDASGFRSLLAEKFDLREKPARFKHHSRSLFTHYIGVKPFDEVSHHPLSKRPPRVKWHGGTLHHLIDRGWFWIIPFNNHKASKNPLISVGLQLDPRKYPKPTDMTPEEEFQSFLDKYPAVKRQFEGAQRVREWVSTDRLQYSSKHSIGYRWCLMSHAAGFIDPLFSRGLSNTFEVVDALVSRVLGALKDGDFSVERFEYVDQLEKGLLHFNDELVNASFISFNHFPLWNAVFRVWGGQLTPGVMRLTSARLRYLLDGDEKHFFDLEDAPHTGLWWPDSDKLLHMLEATAETCEKYEVGELTGDEAAAIVMKLVQENDAINPTFGWKDADDHFIYPSTATMAKFLYWANTAAPPEMRAIGRAFATGIPRAALQGKKLL